jgi:hypothetical protein
MKFYTLLHLQQNEKSLHNGSASSFREQIELYIACIKTLDKSLKRAGSSLSVITNHADYVSEIFDGYQIDIITIPFSLNVPSGISFYSAHFKIDVYKYFSSLDSNYVALVDNDIFCLNAEPPHLKGLIELGIPMYYDVTDQIVPSESREVLLRDKQKVSGDNVIGIWAGGEFMAGPPSFFRLLHDEINAISESYFKHQSTLFHKSDETLTSIAIERLLIRGLNIIDAGGLDIIGRYWSPKPNHVQRSFDAYHDHFLVHLPSDKKFLKAIGDREFDKKSFIGKYKRYLAHRSIHDLASGIKRKLFA